MTNELAKELVDAGFIQEYRLPVGEEELLPRRDEAVVFRDYFVVSLFIPCHRFVLTILDRYQIQLHELMPSAFAHLSKFTWGMVSCGRDLDIEVFVRHFVLHNQQRHIKVNDVQLRAAP